MLNRAEAAHRALKRKAGPLPLSTIANFKHGTGVIVRPNLENMKELPDAVLASEGLSLEDTPKPFICEC